MEATLNGPTGRITLGPTPLTIGRMPGSQLLITDPQASGYHAEIRHEGQGYSIIDLGSTNGTFVNEQLLVPHVSRILFSGDQVRIGGTLFTYEASGLDLFSPTVYVGPQGNTPAIEPTVAVPPPPSYGSNAQQGYPVPQPHYPPAGTPGIPAYMPGGPAKKKSRRGLWITLSIIVVLLLAFSAFGTYAYANRSTPTKTLTTFCNDLKSGNYHDAYQQLSSSDQSKVSEEKFTSSLQQSFASAGGLKDCTFSNESDDGSTGTAVMTLTLNLTLVPPINYHTTLVNESSTWKINQITRQT
jgi:hypothetical protein